jgi:hypothetical protein
MSDAAKYPCPCCGYLIFEEPPGSYDICNVCGWEDDLSQLRFPSMGGANRVSLIEGQSNFEEFGVSELRKRPHIRNLTSIDNRDPEWRSIKENTGNIERPVPGVDYGQTYPADRTALYYWRPSYWRK